MANDVELPGLPASDETSLTRNSYDGFYNVKAREFWGKNRIVSRKVDDFQSCRHYFVSKDAEIRCRNCNMGFPSGLVGVIEGKLVINGKTLEL